MNKSMSGTTERASAIIEAVARLQAAFLDAGLREPVAIVVRGEEQQRLLEHVFHSHLGLMAPQNVERPWEGATIRGMKVVCNVAA